MQNWSRYFLSHRDGIFACSSFSLNACLFFFQPLPAPAGTGAALGNQTDDPDVETSFKGVPAVYSRLPGFFQVHCPALKVSLSE